MDVFNNNNKKKKNSEYNVLSICCKKKNISFLNQFPLKTFNITCKY